MRKILLFILVVVLGGCVTKRVYVRDVLASYKKGLKVGRVIGRDDILLKLKSPDCFTQKPDELMNGDPVWNNRPDEPTNKTDDKLKSNRRNP